MTKIIFSKKYARLASILEKHKTDVMLFVASGLLAFICDFSTLQLVDKVTKNLLLATSSGIAVGFLVSFFLNQLRFNKRHEDVRRPKESIVFFLVLFVFNTIFTFICLSINERYVNYPRFFIKVGTVACIMVWNYILFHKIIFRKV